MDKKQELEEARQLLISIKNKRINEEDVLKKANDSKYQEKILLKMIDNSVASIDTYLMLIEYYIKQKDFGSALIYLRLGYEQKLEPVIQLETMLRNLEFKVLDQFELLKPKISPKLNNAFLNSNSDNLITQELQDKILYLQTKLPIKQTNEEDFDEDIEEDTNNSLNFAVRYENSISQYSDIPEKVEQCRQGNNYLPIDINEYDDPLILKLPNDDSDMFSQTLLDQVDQLKWTYSQKENYDSINPNPIPQEKLMQRTPLGEIKIIEYPKLLTPITEWQHEKCTISNQK